MAGKCPRCESLHVGYKHESDDWLTCKECQYEFVPGEPHEYEQDARDAYAAHVETMAELHSHLAPLKSWDDQDASIRGAWRLVQEGGR